MTMQYAFNAASDAKWRDIVPGEPLTIPAAATQIFFREKPELRYEITWVDSGSYSDIVYDREKALEILTDLTDKGLEPNLYVRKYL